MTIRPKNHSADPSLHHATQGFGVGVHGGTQMRLSRHIHVSERRIEETTKKQMKKKTKTAKQRDRTPPPPHPKKNRRTKRKRFPLSNVFGCKDVHALRLRPPWYAGAFQLEVSVDQDLSVTVAEAIDDDVVKQNLVPIVFTRA